tara:strand:+ start:369 stop:554 length:186 start_codon:yes stop_codon:yes gene_type:complete
MVDHSRSNRIIEAAHQRGDIKPVPVLDVIRKRLRADEDLSFIADLPDQPLETLRQAVLGED